MVFSHLFQTVLCVLCPWGVGDAKTRRHTTRREDTNFHAPPTTWLLLCVCVCVCVGFAFFGAMLFVVRVGLSGKNEVTKNYETWL